MLLKFETSSYSRWRWAWGYFPEISSFAFSPSSTFLTAMMIFHPALPAKFSTIPQPMPLLDPVTMMFLSAFIISFQISYSFGIQYPTIRKYKIINKKSKLPIQVFINRSFQTHSDEGIVYIFNTMFVQKNCFERQTDLLGEDKIKSQIIAIYQISNLIVKYEYESALQMIDTFQKTFEFQEDSLYYEFQLMEALCLYQLKNLQKVKKICQGIYEELGQEEQQVKQREQRIADSEQVSITDLALELKRSFSVRFYTFIANLGIEGHNIGIQVQNILKRLIKILKIDEYVYLPEVLGTLTGCRNFRNIHKINQLKGEQDRKKAKKLEMLAVWKYLINQKNQCIKLKTKALEIWKNENLLKQKQKCEEQLNELLEKITNSKKAQGKFIKKIKRMDYFTRELIELQKKSQKLPKKQGWLKWYFPIFLKDSYLLQEDKKSQVINLTQSKFLKVNDKRNQLLSVIQKSDQFCENHKKQINSQISGLIYNSKFMDEGVKLISKKFLIFAKIKRRYPMRIAMGILKDFAVARFKRLGKIKK